MKFSKGQLIRTAYSQIGKIESSHFEAGREWCGVALLDGSHEWHLASSLETV
jgi:hypothetical protein